MRILLGSAAIACTLGLWSCTKSSGGEHTTSNLSIKSYSVSSGRFGEGVTITGTGFSSTVSEGIVTFNGKPALVYNATVTSITAAIPQGAGTGPIAITVNGKTVTGPTFTYLLTGSVNPFVGQTAPGFVDGDINIAQFNYPTGIAVDGSGNIYVADNNNNAIRKITPAGSVSTVAGNGTDGHRDGSVSVATFSCPEAVAVDKGGNIYVSDACNHVIRRISTAGQVTTVAGSGIRGYQDGSVATAQFHDVSGIAVDNANTI